MFDGRRVQGIAGDASKLQRVFKSLKVSGSAWVFLVVCGGGGMSPQTSAWERLHPEDRRSSTGDAFLCAPAASTWGHDAFVSKHSEKHQVAVVVVGTKGEVLENAPAMEKQDLTEVNLVVFDPLTENYEQRGSVGSWRRRHYLPQVDFDRGRGIHRAKKSESAQRDKKRITHYFADDRTKVPRAVQANENGDREGFVELCGSDRHAGVGHLDCPRDDSLGNAG